MSHSASSAHELLQGQDRGLPVLECFGICASSPEEGQVYDITVVEGERRLEVQRHYRDFHWLHASINSHWRSISTLALPKKPWCGLRQTLMRARWATRQTLALRLYLEHLLSQVITVDDVAPLRDFLGPTHLLQHGHCSFAYQDALAIVRKGSRHEGGHTDSVNYMAMSCDMQLIVSASEDTTCRVWSVCDLRWKCQQVLQGHTAGVDGVAISSDRSMIATSSEDATCRLWVLRQQLWECVQVLEGHEAAVRFLAIAKDLSFIVSVSDDTTVRLWRGEGEWRCRSILRGHTAAVYGVSIAKDGSFLATGSDDCTCRVWAVAGDQWECEQVLTGHQAGVYSVVLSSCNSLLASTSGDFTCRLWRQSNSVWEPLQVLSGHNAEVYDVAIACDLSLIATGDDSGACHLWTKLETGEWRRRQVLRGHRQTIYGVQIALGRRPGEVTIGTGSQDQTSIIWRYDGKLAYKSTHVRPAYDWEVGWSILTLLIYFIQNIAVATTNQFFSRTQDRALRVIRKTVSFTILSFRLDLPPMTQFVTESVTALVAASLLLALASRSQGRKIIFCLATFLVTPVVRRLFIIFDCSGGHLSVVPEVGCYEGPHLYLAVAAASVGLPYLFLVMGPLAAVSGDISLMPAHVWLKPAEWVQRRQDKIKGLDLGLASPSFRGGVIYAYTNVLTRVSLLALSVFVDEIEPLNSLLSLGVTSLALTVSSCLHPMEHEVANVLVAAGQLFACTAFLAASLAALLPDPSPVPEVAFFFGWGGTVGFLLTWLSVKGFRSSARARYREHGTVCWH